MSIIGDKVRQFERDIRRSQRQRIISHYRNQLINSIAFDELFQKLVADKPQEVSKEFVSALSTLSHKEIEKIITFLEQSQIVFSHSGHNNPSQWFFDCMSANNLKLVSFLQQNAERSSFVQEFFNKTIKTHQDYQNLSAVYQLQVKESQCYIHPNVLISANMSQQTILGFIQKTTNLQKMLALLQYWSIYMVNQKRETLVLHDYVIMIRTFLTWYQHTQISKYRQAYSFTCSALRLIRELRLFQVKVRYQKLNQACFTFVQKMKIWLPYLLGNLDFKEVGEITIEMIKISESIQGILPELHYRSETIINYLKKIFQLDLQANNIISIKIGIRLVYYLLIQTQIIQNCSKIDKISIFQIFINSYIFNKQLQYYVVFTLKQFASVDVYGTLVKQFESLDFQRLLQNENPRFQQLIFQFTNMVLLNYKQNKILCEKILKNACFIEKLIDFSERQEQNEKMFIMLIKVFDSSINYYIDNWTEQVYKVKYYAVQLKFEGKENFLGEIERQLQLRMLQANL